MSNKFKVGDKVRCVRADGILIVGSVYEISGVSSSGHAVGVGGSKANDWYADRFVLVESQDRKFKVGDKVKVVGSTGMLIAGSVHEVAEVSVGDFPTDYRVHLVGTPKGLGYYENRFELAQSAPAAPHKPKATGFAVGSKVILRDQSKYTGQWAGPMLVMGTGGGIISCKHLAHNLPGGFPGAELVAYEEPPREFRLRNIGGGVNSTKKFDSLDDAVEHGRKNFNEGVEFEVVEMLPVAKYKVSKTVEAVS
ncbi:hypothetical protein LMG10661_00786 [Ralstonia syzygii subsp. syzygii]|nr:hypothetical protein LMG10661_00786 [Ralstonia syzygii subsp. syzygii]